MDSLTAGVLRTVRWGGCVLNYLGAVRGGQTHTNNLTGIRADVAEGGTPGSRPRPRSQTHTFSIHYHIARAYRLSQALRVQGEFPPDCILLGSTIRRAPVVRVRKC